MTNRQEKTSGRLGSRFPNLKAVPGPAEGEFQLSWDSLSRFPIRHDDCTIMQSETISVRELRQNADVGRNTPIQFIGFQGQKSVNHNDRNQNSFPT